MPIEKSIKRPNPGKQISKPNPGKQIKLCGITFRRAEVIWEDAFKINKHPLKHVVDLLKKPKMLGPEPSTFCYYAKVRGHMLLIQEYEPAGETGDFTVVPLRPKIKIVRA